eukprot:4330481-Pleurochrysis_carterae.AAC.1
MPFFSFGNGRRRGRDCLALDSLCGAARFKPLRRAPILSQWFSLDLDGSHPISMDHSRMPPVLPQEVHRCMMDAANIIRMKKANGQATGGAVAARPRRSVRVVVAEARDAGILHAVHSRSAAMDAEKLTIYAKCALFCRQPKITIIMRE